jgi:hypothetical protein
MFISTRHLVTKYGIDEVIARFFVDREPPANNLYWHEKLLYLRPAPGYLFIPLIIDLLFKVGLSKKDLLSHAFVEIMEGVGDISAHEETRRIAVDTAIKNCDKLVEPVAINVAWLAIVKKYFNGNDDNLIATLSTPFTSLHRGDFFLYSLSMVNFSEELFEKVTEQWFALISTLLLLDDAEDLESDLATGEENAYIESGLNADGLHRINVLLQVSLEKIALVNPTMAAELGRQHAEVSLLLSYRNLNASI